MGVGVVGLGELSSDGALQLYARYGTEISKSVTRQKIKKFKTERTSQMR